MKKPNYGIDAPEVVGRFFGLGLLMLAGAAGCWFWKRPWVAPMASMGMSALASAGLMVLGSKVGKLRLRDKMIDWLELKGDERVLDVGCGHGLLLIGAAKRLREGKAVGIDLWQVEDQAGNSREATWKNVELEGVANRVELVDGDARKLPFADKSFDAIVSSWAVHNIYVKEGREMAIREMARVLKPGGKLAIVDIRHTAEYAQILGNAGMENVQRRGPSFVFVIPSFRVTAVKMI
jgi:SAM-dependent methyltransferase